MPIGWRSIGVPAAKAALKPALDALKPQLARRGALEAAGQTGMPSDPEINEAIRLISEDEASLPRLLAASAKKRLSDVPDVFADQQVRIWLQRDDIRVLVASSARAAIAAQSYNDLRITAAASFAEALEDDVWWGEVVFDVAVAFVALSVKGRMNAGDKAVLDNLTFQNSQLSEKQDHLSDQIANVAELVATGTAQPVDAVRALLEPVIQRDDRLRSLVDPSRIDRLVGLAKRVESGDLRTAEPNLRIELFRTTAAALCREKRPDEAEHWIEAARNVGANDLDPDLARLEIAKGNFDGALERLKDRRDCLSVMLSAEALNRGGPKTKGLEYVRRTLTPAQMTGWALASYASWLAEDGAWELAEAALASATPEQINENPLILYSRMRLRLAIMVNPPSERLPLIQTDHSLPVPGRLRNDAEGQRLRRCAVADLHDFRALVPEVSVEHAEWFDAQRLFLVLSDPDQSDAEHALQELQERAGKPESAILFGWLAASLGLNFEDQILRHELARKELLGRLSGPELQAALQLTLRTGDAESILRFLDRYKDQLIDADLPAGLVEGLKVEATAKAGNPEGAREELSRVRGILGEQASASLEAIISEIESGSASVDLWRKAYEGSGSVSDLAQLVDAMAESNHTDLGEFAKELWTKTQRVDLATKSANALFNEGRDIELDALLDQIGDAGDNDEHILKHKAWGAFRAGKLDEARELVLVQRARLPDDAGLRQLEINIGLESGRWKSLAHIGRQDLERAENRDARQLLQGAGLAQLVDDPIADDLARAAVAKAPTDPEILVGAFSAAIQRGTDWGTEAGDWLRAAVEHSGENGPLKSAPLRDFVEMARESQERNTNLNRLIMSGELPLELAAQPLGITLSELILVRLAQNATERDARLRMCLPLIAGNRLKTDLKSFSTFAFDLSSLLALEMVGLLDSTLDELPHILLAAGTLPYLFNDYVRAQRGQKSRASQAQAIKALLVPDGIEVHRRAEGGEEEISELELARSLGAQYVHSFPIHEPGSLGEKVMDVAQYEDIIVSPTGVVDALEAEGEIDEYRGNASRSLLSDSRERWPSERQVDLERPLLLHIVALNALQGAGVLETLVTARKQIIISDEAEEQINRELREWQQLQQPLQAIERVRDKLVSACASGKATHGGYRRKTEEDREDPNSQLIALLKDASGYEVLVSGERAINKTGKLTDLNSLTRPIATIIDVIDHLLERGRINGRQRNEARQKLRESGVAFVPVEVEEIVGAAAQGNWTQGPSKPFRAIIESIHLPLVRGALVLPDELYWFGTVQLQLVRAIERCWMELPIERAEIASSWLLKALPDPKSVVDDTDAQGLDSWAPNARVAFYRTLAQPLSIPAERLEDYHEWFASNVAPQIGGRDRQYRSFLIDALAEASSDVEPIQLEGGEEVSAKEVAQWMLLRIPPNLRSETLRTDRVQQVFGLGAGKIRIGNQVVSPQALWEFLQATLAGRIHPLVDNDGGVIATKGDWYPDCGVVVSDGDRPVVTLDFAGLLHSDPSIRNATLTRLCVGATLPAKAIAEWTAKIADDPIKIGDLQMLHAAFRNTPERWLDEFRDKVGGDLTFSDLQAVGKDYYETFVESAAGRSLLELISETVDLRRHQGNLAHVSYLIAPLAVATDFDINALIVGLNDEEAAGLVSKLATAGDPFSAIAALDIASSRLHSSDFVEIGTQVLESYLGTEGRMEEAAHDFVATARSVIGLADINGTLADEPVAYRRCVLLAHAGLLSREFSNLNVARPKFLEMVERWIGNTYRLGGLVERGSARWWIRERLHPLVIAAQVRMRLKALIRSIPADHRPEAWSSYLDSDGSPPDVLELSTGPLDEFSANWQEQTFPSDEVASAMVSGDIVRDQNVLFNTLLAFEQPSDPDISRESVMDLLRRSDGDAFVQSVELALVAAARWRDDELAEHTFAKAFEKKMGGNWAYRSFVELALASVASITDKAERAKLLEKRLRTLVERQLSPLEAQELVGALDKLTDLMPECAWLSTLRSAALLAV